MNEDALVRSRFRLNTLSNVWTEMRPSNEVRELAEDISKDHPLKAADSLQLAAAIRWCEGETQGVGFICLDQTLLRAATDEGFDALPEAV